MSSKHLEFSADPRAMRTRRRSARLALVGALSILWTFGSLAPTARAQDTWTTPYTGVRQLARRVSGPNRVYALEVNLCAPGVSMRATAESERRATVPSWASARGLEAAVNADFFSFDTYLPSGAAASGGAAWHADGAGSGFVAFGRDRVLFSPPADVVNPLPAWMREVAGGHPLILSEGAVVGGGGDLCTARHPRTAVGLSRDRRRLILMVVDGRRAGVSIGMTCAETARQLLDLGAWMGMNLDGGGSSTMWVRGSGVVNQPSDGSPRVVSNHLGVDATGSGMPGSCMPWEPEEDEFLGGLFGTTTTDLDGDGRADLCARASAGIRCVLADGSPFAATSIAGPALSNDSGWNDIANYATIVMGDVTGDGLADLCARANDRVYCWPSTGTAFGARLDGPTLSDASGWGVPKHYATIRLGDVDGDGKDDLCARAAAGVRCWRSNGAGFDAPWPAIAATSDASGFTDPSRFSTIRVGDVTGDGLADVCARTEEGVDCWASTGTDFDPEPIHGPRWKDSSGWTAHRYYATIRMADVDGDGREDLCARTSTDYRCHLSSGGGFGPAIVIEELSNDLGWGDLSNYETITLADVDGDGDHDVCARADARVLCWLYEGGAFARRIDGPALADDASWGRPIYYRTIRMADVDGDGDDDLCARGSSGIRCWPSTGAGFGAALAGPAWSDADGWWNPIYHTTIRLHTDRRARGLPPPLTPDAGLPTDAGSLTAPDAAVPPDIDAGELTLLDAAISPPTDAGPAPDATAGPATLTSGCACSANRHGRSPLTLAWALGLVSALLLRSRSSSRTKLSQPPVGMRNA